MTILLVDSDWTVLRTAAAAITRKNAAVTVILKSSIREAEQYVMYHPVDIVFVSAGMYNSEFFQKVRSLQPMAECNILGAGQDPTPFLFPYIL